MYGVKIEMGSEGIFYKVVDSALLYIVFEYEIEYNRDKKITLRRIWLNEETHFIR